MIWYIITLASFFCCLISHFIGLTTNYVPVFSFVICGLFFVVSVCVTLTAYCNQKNDRISLDKEVIDINTLHENLRALERDYKVKEKLILEHEKALIEKLSISLKNDKGASGDNVLSHNLLAQIPELNAVESINKLYEKITYNRDRIVSDTKLYNQTVSNIKYRQGNPLIYTPFIPRYNDISYYVISFPES